MSVYLDNAAACPCDSDTIDFYRAVMVRFFCESGVHGVSRCGMCLCIKGVRTAPLRRLVRGGYRIADLDEYGDRRPSDRGRGGGISYTEG